MRQSLHPIPSHLAGAVVGALLAAGLASGCAPAQTPATAASPSATAPAGEPTALLTASPIPPTATPRPVVLADSPASVSYTLPLVVQHVTETGATLFFELGGLVEGGLVYWPVSDPDRREIVSLEGEGPAHQVALSQLEPGKEYAAIAVAGPDPASSSYHPILFGPEPWGPVRFHTPAPPAPLRVGVAGDSGFAHAETFQLFSEMATYDLDLMIHTGDLVYRMDDNTDPYDAYRQKWFAPLAPVLEQMPVYPVVGNHDIEEAAVWQGLSFYYHVFPAFADPLFAPSAHAGRNQWYAFAYGDVQFVMLDTQTFFNEGGHSEQEAWLAGRLADTRFRYTIPVFHVAPFTSGRHRNSAVVIRDRWAPLFSAADVPLVLSGHDHNYQRFAQDGVTYVVSGGGSKTLYELEEDDPPAEVFAERMHFVLLELHPDRIELTSVALGGEVLDQTTLPIE